MIARLTKFQVKADKLDEFKNNFDKRVLTDAKLRKGYRNGYLLADRKTGNCLSIGFWDTEIDAQADDQSGRLRERTDTVKEFFTAPPVREQYEVISMDR